MLEIVKNFEKNIDSAEEKEKEKQVDALLELWEKDENKWIMIGYHDEINQIEDLVIECYSYYLQGDKESYDVSYRKLKRNIEDMRNREIITFANIL